MNSNINSSKNLNLKRINSLLLDQNNNFVGEKTIHKVRGEDSSKDFHNNNVIWLYRDDIAKEINSLMQGKKKSLIEDTVN